MDDDADCDLIKTLCGKNGAFEYYSLAMYHIQ